MLDFGSAEPCSASKAAAPEPPNETFRPHAYSHPEGNRMDAPPMSTLALPRPSLPAPAPHVIAWALVIAVHALIGWWLLTTTRATLTRSDTHRMSVRWLPPPPPASQPIALPSSPDVSPMQRSLRVVSPLQHVVSAPDAATLVDIADPVASAPLDLRLRGDAVSGGDGIDAAALAPKLIGRRTVHAAFQERPRYFRMRPQMSPQQIIAGVAQFLGLWPPGYTDDPCGLGKQDLQYFQDAVDERDRQALRDAIHQVSASCR